MRALFTFAIPLACATHLPGIAILGKADPLAPLAGLGFLAITLVVWRVGVRHCRSTGS